MLGQHVGIYGGTKMANSMYNEALIGVAEDLNKFAKGENMEVDLGAFQAISNTRAANKGKTARKNWSDAGEVTDNATILIPGTHQGVINAHTLAVGDVLFAMGFRGTFYITQALKLTKTKQVSDPRAPIISVNDILAKIKPVE